MQVIFIHPDKSDPEVEEIYNWMTRIIRENSGPGRDLPGGQTWTLRDLIRSIARESPRVYSEMLRMANSNAVTR